MPSHVSAEKRVRKTARRTAVNKNRKSQIRTAVRKVEEALSSGNREAAAAALKVAEPQIMRGVSKGVVHKNTGARKVSRLAARLKKLKS
jgi:small subunit ribosomal protein S20